MTKVRAADQTIDKIMERKRRSMQIRGLRVGHYQGWEKVCHETVARNVLAIAFNSMDGAANVRAAISWTKIVAVRKAITPITKLTQNKRLREIGSVWLTTTIIKPLTRHGHASSHSADGL